MNKWSVNFYQRNVNLSLQAAHVFESCHALIAEGCMVVLQHRYEQHRQ
jgi:hypothetical protein